MSFWSPVSLMALSGPSAGMGLPVGSLQCVNPSAFVVNLVWEHMNQHRPEILVEGGIHCLAKLWEKHININNTKRE